ncbi:hypothetical protein ZTR_05177 [Talaromyces verruculosus]|nr:hypothetical protein ZTR_05177 [Talaromyces verruculosus]
MSHAHFHRHERRDIISEVESFLGINNKNQQSTVTETASVVYVTASPTFTGAIGGYVTGTSSTTTADPTTTAGKGAPVAQSTKTSTTSKADKSSTTTTAAPETTTSSTQSTTSTSSTSLSDLLTTSSDLSTTFATSSSTQSASSTSSTGTAVDQFSSSTASATTSAAASASNGLTGGAKAGIAIGVLGGIGLIAGLVLFWLHKQRKNREEAAAAAAAAENEKFARSQPPPMTSAPPPKSMGAYSSAPSTPATAPQVSLRPITQFNPMLTQPGGANPYAAGAAVGAAAGAAAAGGLQVNRLNAQAWMAQFKVLRRVLVSLHDLYSLDARLDLTDLEVLVLEVHPSWDLMEGPCLQLVAAWDLLLKCEVLLHVSTMTVAL